MTVHRGGFAALKTNRVYWDIAMMGHQEMASCRTLLDCIVLLNTTQYNKLDSVDI